LANRFRSQGAPSAQAVAALQWVQDEIRYVSVAIGENSHWYQRAAARGVFDAAYARPSAIWVICKKMGRADQGHEAGRSLVSQAGPGTWRKPCAG